MQDPAPETSAAGPDGPGRTRRHSAVRESLEVVAVIALVTAAGFLLSPNYRALGHVYLLAVVVLSLRVGRWPVLGAAVLSAVAWNFLFMPPRFSFHILSVDDGLLLGTYFAVALIAGQLTTRVRERQKLLARAELQRTLLDTVSHELKTPLSVLRSAAEKVDTGDAKKRAAVASEIRTATDRLDRLVANLLGQTRLESGGIRPQLDWCDARDLVNAARRAAADALADRRVEVDIPADLPLFRADAPLMEHALANLLLNAGWHTPPGTPVSITAGLDRAGSRVFIAVADRGPGLPPEIRDGLFGKFRRGGSARPGGLGLGLSIVQGFTKAQGGGVLARDRPGGGAEFTVYLPYSPHGTLPADED